MIECSDLFNELRLKGVDFFCGVPDSLLKDFCAYITCNTSQNEHIIAANEGAALSIAAGYHLTTGKIPLVYLQNSGLGNLINPLLSLADKEVYGIPVILMIGWRGEPGKKDEPQHIKQGRVQNKILEAMEVQYKILDSSIKEITLFVEDIFSETLRRQSPTAIVVREKTFSPFNLHLQTEQNFEMSREIAIIKVLSKLSEDSIVVSTTGKLSREVFEFRERTNKNHQQDFLTVGSMGHCSQIALGISLYSSKKIVCLDGDGALIMHMGSLGIIGNNAHKNFFHFVFNNGAHESVGGQSTVGLSIDIVKIALGCGYKFAFSISTEKELLKVLDNVFDLEGPLLVEIKINKLSRKDLGRPSKTPTENKNALMKFISRNV
ncbi:MAG TPA: phosphonopyruvate decarboxylase [Ignavibacteriaceae bacterium]|nr:phosphonopyruvate decarboxylase [Ignavibacteriaceae bacterium]